MARIKKLSEFVKRRETVALKPWQRPRRWQKQDMDLFKLPLAERRSFLADQSTEYLESLLTEQNKVLARFSAGSLSPKGLNGEKLREWLLNRTDKNIQLLKALRKRCFVP